MTPARRQKIRVVEEVTTIPHRCPACSSYGENFKVAVSIVGLPLTECRCLCLDCGHIYMFDAEGSPIPLRAEQKRLMRVEPDARSNQQLRAAQEKIVRNMWG